MTGYGNPLLLIFSSLSLWTTITPGVRDTTVKTGFRLELFITDRSKAVSLSRFTNIIIVCQLSVSLTFVYYMYLVLSRGQQLLKS